MIGIVNESCRRIAISPTVCKKLKDQLKIDVIMESGAGVSAGFLDDDYKDLATLTNRVDVLAKAKILPTVEPLSSDDLKLVNKDCLLISMFEPFNKTDIVDELKGLGLQAFSLDMIPRSTLAQSVDVLSSMASLSGYKAVLVAAAENTRSFPMMMTAAGTIKPANALILGAGVAGLQAIATAKRLGAKVSVFDVRASSKQEVESLGAKFIEVEGAVDSKDAGGYALQQTEEYKQRQKDLIHEQSLKSDLIITTAQIRGRKAPILVEDRTVKAMRPGSVIVDLAVKSGGNTTFTKEGKSITDNGVIIVGDSDLADTMPDHSSNLIANNFFNFMKLLVNEGEVSIDMENPILESSLITKS